MLFSSQQDHDTQRLYRLYDFSKSQIIHPDGFCCVAGKVNSADKLYLVIESVKRDTQPQLDSNALAPAERAGGSVAVNSYWTPCATILHAADCFIASQSRRTWLGVR